MDADDAKPWFWGWWGEKEGLWFERWRPCMCASVSLSLSREERLREREAMIKRKREIR